MKTHDVDIAVIGAGIVGISTAYYLAIAHGRSRVLILESDQPMSLTSAQSGENYRNWWPHPAMTAFTDHSMDLMETIARRTGNRFHMTRRGYLLATRAANPEALIAALHAGYGETAASAIRVHDRSPAPAYRPPHSADWEAAPTGVDVLASPALIREHFPYLAPDIATILHIRRAGDISGQQLGQVMLEEARAAGARLMRAEVRAIAPGSPHRIEIEPAGGGARELVRADAIVNAAGPFAAAVAALHGETLPVINVLQQKIAFPDRLGAVSRTMPFAIDLDGQSIAWSAAEREEIARELALARFLGPMPGGIHCRPDGGTRGSWIKLGWAYNSEPGVPSREPVLDDNFPEIVVRAAARMQPALAPYVGALPRERVHYGGSYTMTAENWPLIGAARTPGVFLATALSGYGTMAACATGDLCARAVVGASAPAFAKALSLARHHDAGLMRELASSASRGVL